MKDRPKTPCESSLRIEPTRLHSVEETISDLVADIAASSATLGKALHPTTAANLAGLIRIMNTYYSNLIEGHNTRPQDIERAVNDDLEKNPERRNLQIEARAHLRLQEQCDRLYMTGELPEPTSIEFIVWLHKEFYREVPSEMLRIAGKTASFEMQPGVFRSRPEHDVVVGRHIPPSGPFVVEFMKYFSARFESSQFAGPSARMIALAAAHHRFNYIHPFPDGNGRVSRLISHAMAQRFGIGAHGLWSISRGLARGINSRNEYKSMMDLADTPRHGDLDGRGNLSQAALAEFVEWFLRICLDQIKFMTSLLDLDRLILRLRRFTETTPHLHPAVGRILEEALIRGEVLRGDIQRVTGLPERTARRVLNEAINTGILSSSTPKGPVSLRFPTSTLDTLFPTLFPNV